MAIHVGSGPTSGGRPAYRRGPLEKTSDLKTVLEVFSRRSPDALRSGTTRAEG